MHNSRTCKNRFVALAAIVLAVPTSGAAGQSDSTFLRVTGVVGDVQTGRAVPHALAAIPAVGVRILADEHGRFHFDRVPPGSFTWLFQALGYADWSEEMSVEDGEHLRVGLLPQPVVLETIVATTSRLAERRNTSGLSVTALSWVEIQAVAATNLAQIVTNRSPHPAVSCPPDAAGVDADVGLCLRWRGRTISPQIYLDEQSIPVPLDVLYQFMPHEIHTIEYYQHPARGTIIRIYTLEFMKSGKVLLPSSALFR